MQVGLSIALPLSCSCARALPLFIHGREITSLSFTALSIGLVVFAIMLALAAMVMLFRPNKEEDAKEARKQGLVGDAARQEEAGSVPGKPAAFQNRARAQLGRPRALPRRRDYAGRARCWTKAKDARAENNLFQQRLRALVSTAARGGEPPARSANATACTERIDLRAERTSRAPSTGLSRRSRSSAWGSWRPARPQPPLRRAQTGAFPCPAPARLRRVQATVPADPHAPGRGARDYAQLLLARRMLESAIATWESKSQPEVYRQTDRLLSLMTDGRWTKVSLTAEGRLRVTDAVKTTRDPAICRWARASSCTSRCASPC